MKTSDFRLLKNVAPWVAALPGLLLMFAGYCAWAAPPPIDNFEKPSELILTLSDQSLGLDASNKRLLDSAGNGSASLPAAGRQKKRPVDLGCGVDVNPFPDLNNSLPSRLIGECNFRYHY